MALTVGGPVLVHVPQYTRTHMGKMFLKICATHLRFCWLQLHNFPRCESAQLKPSVESEQQHRDMCIPLWNTWCHTSFKLGWQKTIHLRHDAEQNHGKVTDKSKTAKGLRCIRKMSFLFYDCTKCLTSRQFPFNRPRLPHFCLIPMRVYVQDGSLPSQLCPCARAISLCLTFTTQLPVDHPPLQHFVPLTITHHEPTAKEDGNNSLLPPLPL